MGAGKLGIAENVTIAFNLLHFSKLDDFIEQKTKNLISTRAANQCLTYLSQYQRLPLERIFSFF